MFAPLVFINLRTRTLAALAGASALALVAFGLPLFRLVKEKETGVELSQIRERADIIEKTFDALINMETGVRGYLYAKDTKYLQPYYLGLGQFEQLKPQLQKLKRLHRADMEKLESLAAEQIRISRQLIAQPGTLKLDRQKSLMDAKREIVVRIQQEEDRRRTEVLGRRQRAWRSDTIVIAIALISVIWLLIIVVKHVNEMVAAHTALEAIKVSEHESRLLFEEVAATKSQIITTLSHEIGTPLTQVRMALEALRNRVQDESLLQLLALGVEGVRKLSQIAADILQLERLYSGSDLQLSSVELNEWCFSLALELDIDRIQVSAPPGHFRIDVILLRLILKNLLINALKYSESAVVLRVMREREAQIFTVKDSGRGIPSEQLKQVWEPFIRGQNAGLTPGTGLGLAIVKRATEKLGGEISLESVEGQGTTVTLKLPLQSNGKG